MLGGEHYGHVTLNNLRMMLLAVKGIHMQPEAPLLTIDAGKNTLVKIDGPYGEPIGIFGSKGDIYLFECDISRVISIFSAFNQNRLEFEQKLHL